VTVAVGKAVEERLQRVRATKKKGELAARLLEIGRECSALFKEPYRSIDHGELLYDEKGLPK
jgi:antitoxin VapB